MPKSTNKAPRLPNGSRHATNAPDGRGSFTSPISPSQQLPSALEVNQLKQACHFKRSAVTENALPQNVGLVQVVPWRDVEESDYVIAFSCLSTSRLTVLAGFGPSNNSNTTWVDTQQAQDTIGNDELFPTESPRAGHQSADKRAVVDEATHIPTIFTHGSLDVAFDHFFFSNPRKLPLSIPYPTTIIENTPSLCQQKTRADYSTIVPA